MTNSGVGISSLSQRIFNIRWLIIGVIGLLIFFLEFNEHPTALQQFDRVFTSEVFFLETFLITIGLTVSWLMSSIREKSSTLNILEAKNNLSQQLTKAKDWYLVTELLVDFPRSILPLAGSSLLVYSPQSDQFEVTSYWVSELHNIVPAIHFHGMTACERCSTSSSLELRAIGGDCLHEHNQIPGYDCYCLPLNYNGSLAALMHFCLPNEEILTQEQIDLINSLAPEMAVALKVAEENHTRQKLLAEKTAEEVRKGITRDMHDMLAQNLAYLQLKLDQMANDHHIQDVSELEGQLLRLRDVSNESYELVRGTLGALHPNNASRLGDILFHLANTFAERGEFEVEFFQDGNARRLDPQVMHNVYQLYREALSNIYKHARANHVTTNLDWYEDKFTLRVIDDGLGFNPREVEQYNHYGLASMLERVKQLDGQLLIESGPGVGTCIDVTIHLAHSNGTSTENQII